MTRRLLLSYLTLTAFVLLVLEIPLGTNYAHNERSALIANVEHDALVLGTFAEDTLETGTKDQTLTVAQRYGHETGARVIVVDKKGTAILDTAVAVPGETDFSNRPEIQQALAGRVSSGIRHSNTLGADLLFVAVPVASGGVVHGAVRITYPISALSARIRRNWLALGLVAVTVLAAASLVGWLLARSLARPVRDLERAAASIAGGELSARSAATAGPAELRELSRTFNDMAARLEELIGAQRAFVADASHQLRTPLTALRLRLENLESSLSPRGRDDLEGAIRESSRLSRIVDGLLALARAEGARPERAPVDVDAAVRERFAAWEPLAAERGIELRVESAGGAGLAAPGHLEQILDNYLANAIDVAPAGSAVTLRTEPSDGWIEVHVADHGPGMSAEERERAFDRFWRLRQGGTGLGLAIVRQLAGANGGEAELRETPGGGLDAVVRLRRP